MTKNYDNWERLVEATLLREKLRELSRLDSMSSSSSTASSSFRRLPDLGKSSSILSRLNLLKPFYIFRRSNPTPPFSSTLRRSNPTPPFSSTLRRSNLGVSISYAEIVQSTDYFSSRSLMKKGRSGDLFIGFLPQFPESVVIRRVDFRVIEKDDFSSELDILSKMNVSESRCVPAVVGHCLEVEHEMKYFLVYKYATKGDLLNCMYNDEGKMDFITRSKIAIGIAEALSYLHHQPIVHGHVQASSILVDNHYQVRLGSWSRARNGQVLERSKISGAQNNIDCAYDVYCFGKLLLELVTGNMGITSSPADAAAMNKWLQETLPYISIYDKELLARIVDPCLIVDEDLFDEVWAMAIVAKSCLSPKPTKRPAMRYIVIALENPLKVVRE